MLRRLHPDQPDTFAFTPDNQAWAEAQITKYPEGRQASAIIPLLWRAQEQEGWLTRPAIEAVADMLDLAYIRALEVASFYFMFQLQPVGSVAHIQVCGTTSCMICGAEDLVAVCKDKIASKAHQLSADGKFSWEEVECLGSCANAPMAQIGKDYYEDLTAARMGEIIDELAAGEVPTPGPQNGRYAAEPLSGLTSLKDFDSGHTKYNASVQLATDIGDTIKRIDGTEVPLLAPWGKANDNVAPSGDMMPPDGPDGKQGGRTKAEAPAPRARGAASDGKSEAPGQAPQAEAAAKPKLDAAVTESKSEQKQADKAVPAGTKPALLPEARDGGADDLKLIKGVGPGLEKELNAAGVYHFDQIAAWTDDEVAWADQHLVRFKGRVSRDDWVTQAKALSRGEQTEFSQRAKKDGIYKE
ncbi:NADH-quinone oxidoreductase subunit E [Tateyamaria omphalii]|uniref:NADH-quinone oxidoreductase subunit E n=1 Tax=Tateyamaria omphalii TaxID=299262 RepID=A0A1P8MUJ5_9RHOB|nr:NADH-quinone oxidoreductase subunit E [Tateyamaria omphalii]APX11767.1 NADH-quinone oxidoreductase subunit E [Tateyamaria omphalii]